MLFRSRNMLRGSAPLGAHGFGNAALGRSARVPSTCPATLKALHVLTHVTPGAAFRLGKDQATGNRDVEQVGRTLIHTVFWRTDGVQGLRLAMREVGVLENVRSRAADD